MIYVYVEREKELPDDHRSERTQCVRDIELHHDGIARSNNDIGFPVSRLLTVYLQKYAQKNTAKVKVKCFRT